tara:strand:- start:1169 stop:2968 length:1800 start_codon:yes stop_codon:yes gene_type:complete
LNIKEIVNNLPSNPGVYFFKDKKDKIIYIGKAKNLKKRVSSYFNISNSSSKNKVMISKASDLEIIIVGSEVEALLTESNLIKIHKPRYNVFMKDDKTFPYIIISNEDYPRVEIIRKKKIFKDKHIYFGPYTDVYYLKSVLKTLHQIFPIKTCDYKLIGIEKINKQKTCFCGFCLSEKTITTDEYDKMISKVISFLKGRNKDVKIYLTNLMKEASDDFRYEQAARLRNQIIALEAFIKKQTKLTQNFENQDIFNISYKGNYGIAFVMRIRNGLLVGKESFSLKINSIFNLASELDKFIVQYYHLTMDIPSEIIIPCEIKNSDNIKEWLFEKFKKRISIFSPMRGNKKKILQVCIKNNDLKLKEMLFRKIKRKEYIPKILSELKDALNMPVIPNRIEAFDNSNINGSNPVAGLVCFVNGKPVKNEYRHFNIKTVIGIDDFESMREVIYRRYKRQIKEKNKLPDLILIDGGKGQLSSAKSSLNKLGLGYITIIGLAKKLEDVYLPGFSNPQNISKTSSSLYLLRNIRDEVHRYSINFHRVKRSKSLFNSRLKDINGIGARKIRIIWDNYENLQDLKSDTIKNIKNKTGFTEELIKKIKNNLK